MTDDTIKAILAKGDGGDVAGAMSDAERETKAVLAETLGMIESDMTIRDAGLAEWNTDQNRFAILTFALLRGSPLLSVLSLTDPQIVSDMKGFAQTVFLIGYVAGRKAA